MGKAMFSYDQIESKIGYKFKDRNILKVAFTHSSYANENKVQSNERLEFLGDSVLQYVITRKLYDDYSMSEGNLSKFRQKLVSEEPLAFVVEELGLDAYLLKGKGELKSKVDSKAMKADLFESIIGAICLDSGLEESKKFVLSCLQSVINAYGASGDFEDAKTKLQEKMASSKIIYNTKKYDLSGHFEYKSTVMVNGVACGNGSGHNKKTAEQMAAREALNKITKE